jgi:hypothetical protein
MNTLATLFNETLGVVCLLHPLAKVNLPLFVNDFHPKIEVTLNQDAFNFDFVFLSHFSLDGPSSMVHELLRNYFVPNDSTSGFNLFFEVCGHITQGHVPLSISHLFFRSQLLMLKKQFGNIHPIAFSEVTYHLVVCTLAIQFKDVFAKHFNPHQFGVVTHDGCKIVIHGVLAMLKLHPNWVVL